jgi:DNA-binding NarL/FixJ family response regulator
MEENRRIVIAEDNKLLRESISSMLSSYHEFEIVGEAKDGFEAIDCVEKQKPDLILLDLVMPRLNGLAVIQDIKNLSPETKILALTVYEDEEYIIAALQSGAEGYCLKDAGREGLLRAIRSVFSGEPYLSPKILKKVMDGYLERSGMLKVTSSLDSLTRREREVLKLVGEGYKNREIADYLGISVKTVEKHRSNLMKKLDLHNTAALTAYAIEKGLVK